MSEFSELIAEILNEQIGNLHTATIGRIVRLDGNRADVQPDDLPLLINLPVVGGNCIPGDEVVVIFIEKNLSKGIIIGNFNEVRRNIYTSTEDPTDEEGRDGDLWFVYE